MPTAKIGLRQQRAEHTRQRLFECARDLLAERGYQDATVAEICKRAQVAKGTFFVHFASKDAVVVELVGAQVSDARNAHRRCYENGESPLAAIVVVLQRLARHASRNHAISRCVFAAMHSNPSIGENVHDLFEGLRGDLIRSVENAQREGLMAAMLDAELVATSLLSLYYGASLQFAAGGDRPGIERLVLDLLAVNLPHFLTAKGRRRWKKE